MKKEYYPKTDKEKLGYLIEECGETMAAVGKSIRWGLECSNPEESEGQTNRSWVIDELKDLKRAIRLVEERLDEMEF